MQSRDAARPLLYKGYIPGLDVLRGLAILMVLVYHGVDGRVPWSTVESSFRWPIFLTQYGAAGVTLFFILSGFLITGILVDTAAKPDYFKKFYVRRFLRIMPAYLLMLIILKTAHVISWKFVLAALLYIANMSGLVGARNYEYGALWSLAVEEQFYLLWPVIVRRLSLQSLTRIAVGYYFIDIAMRLVLLRFAPSLDTTYKLWFNAEALLTGALIALLLRQNILRRDNLDRTLWILGSIATVSFPFLFYVDSRTATTLPVFVHVLYTISKLPYLCVFTVMLLLVIKHNDGETLRSPLTRLLIFFGYISYGLYLVHQLVFFEVDRLTQGQWLGNYTRSTAPLLVNTLLCILISILLAYLSRRFFEEYFLRKKDVVVPYRDPSINEAPVSEGT